MFDILLSASETGPSVVEERLAQWLAADAERGVQVVRPRRPVLIEFEPHGDASTRPTVSEAAASELRAEEAGAVHVEAQAAGVDVEPAAARLAGLLEAGAAHLERAREAQRAQSQAAAVQARALAAFAAARPAGALDRPDTEVGAAAAASRAARPAALTAVSEWAVDEVMVALGLSSQAASALLAESVTLVQLLPATLDALDAAEISWAHARMLTEVLAPIADPTVRGVVEARVLARAGRRCRRCGWRRSGRCCAPMRPRPPAGTGLGPPPPTDGYRPSDPQQRFLRARDRRCRFPACRTPAARCDLDHNRPWPAGATSCDNLCCLCRHHHRLSHQAPGWTITASPTAACDGPPPAATPSPPTHPATAPTTTPPPPPPARPERLTLRERVLGRPATPEERRNDPPPF